jgi:hypothetical protein
MTFRGSRKVSEKQGFTPFPCFAPDYLRRSRRGENMNKTEEQVLKELRKIDWGKLTVVKKNGEIVMISPTTDIKTSRD